jgi:hypothetical protein
MNRAAMTPPLPSFPLTTLPEDKGSKAFRSCKLPMRPNRKFLVFSVIPGAPSAGQSPSTVLAMMFFCTSFDPPKIVQALLFR